MKRVASGILLTLLLVSIATLAFNIRPIKAEGTIYIRADGSIEGTTQIQTVDNVTYFLTADIDGYMEIQRDNIILDGQGYMLEGFAGTAAGIYLENRTNVTIQDVHVDDHYYSIFLKFSSNNTISRCKVTSSAINLDRSSNNTISGNDIEYFGSFGIVLSRSDNNSISENTMNCGIAIIGSNHNNISQNNIAGAGTAIQLASRYIDGIKFSSNNTISGNKIENNGIGVLVDSTSNNTIHHNNFINNAQQVNVTAGSTTFWDIGYPSGGNYWSDYTGNDSHSGPYQNETGSDGIGDSPYVINANNTDHCPLMNPWNDIPKALVILEPENVSTTTGLVTVAFTIKSIGDDVEFLEGDPSNRIDLEIEYSEPNVHGILLWSTSYYGLVLHTGEIYSVHIVYNPLEYGIVTIRLVHWKLENGAYVVGELGKTEIQVTLLPTMMISISPVSTTTYLGQSVNFTSATSGGTPPYGYQWYLNGSAVSGANSSSWTLTLQPMGTYGVWLNVTDSLGSTAKSNQASVAVVPFVDLNIDGKVDVRDISLVASAFGSSLGQPRWNPLADVDQDRKVGIRDIALVAKHFGEHYL